MLKTKVHVAKVGDLIRALDFPGTMDCYLIGLVTDVEGEMIKCKTMVRVWEGKSEREEGTFTTVQEGVNFLDKRYPGRITVL